MAPHMRLNSFWSADWDFHWRTVKRSQHLPERPNATAIHRGHQSLTLQLILPVSWLETSETISTPTLPPLSMRPLLRSVQLQLPPSLSPHMLLGQAGMRRTIFFKGFAQTHRTHSTDRYKPMWHYMAALGSLQLRKIRWNKPISIWVELELELTRDCALWVVFEAAAISAVSISCTAAPPKISTWPCWDAQVLP